VPESGVCADRPLNARSRPAGEDELAFTLEMLASDELAFTLETLASDELVCTECVAERFR